MTSEFRRNPAAKQQPSSKTILKRRASASAQQQEERSGPKRLKNQSLDKRTRCVAVYGLDPVKDEHRLLNHMQTFGTLLDMDARAATDKRPAFAVFTFQTRQEAENAIEFGGEEPVDGVRLKLEWWDVKDGDSEAKATGVVPDAKRAASERLSAHQLLRSVDKEEEEEEEGNEEDV